MITDVAEFAAWPEWIFGHHWHGIRSDIWADLWPSAENAIDAGDARKRVAWLTCLFEELKVLAQFSDRAVGLGLRFLCDPSCSDHMYSLLDPSVAASERTRCIRAIGCLYRDTFAARCVSARIPDVPRGAPCFELNASCFDFWYLCCVRPAGCSPDGEPSAARAVAVFIEAFPGLHVLRSVRGAAGRGAP